uniref:NmrA family transcriptional regulator n=1 Tax=Thermosporothrix sp. COM3 TaxID=2490863 RepID=A0A455SLF1_9CHLR|nr:NmrA family transcriptional regulator [Thermosporothrix sp. COM3]
MNKKILVTGATGKQGGGTVHHLQKRGWQVRALVRDIQSAKAQQLQAWGVELVQGNLNDPAVLRQAMEGVHGVFSVQTFLEEGLEAEARQGKAVADAAHDMGVSHLVYSSADGVERGSGIAHFESKWQVEQHIRALGLPATILRPVFFMSNLPFLTTTQPDGSYELSLGIYADTVLQMVSTDDIGAFAALAFDQPERFLGKEVGLAGDELTPVQIAATIERITGKPTRFVELPSGGERMYEWFNESGFQADIASLRKIYPSLMTLEAWLQQMGFQPMR